MKQFYEAPEAEIVRFVAEECLTANDPSFTGYNPFGSNPDGDWDDYFN